jgi:hypothetical protein
VSPLSTVVLTAYLVVIPLILVAGIVWAVRARNRLGHVATRRLAAGAVALLVAHAFTALRPVLLRTVFDQPDPLMNVADASSFLALAQLTAQGVGIGLVIAAVFAAARREPEQAK